jgi:hypothetical protein
VHDLAGRRHLKALLGAGIRFYLRHFTGNY